MKAYNEDNIVTVRSAVWRLMDEEISENEETSWVAVEMIRKKGWVRYLPVDDEGNHWFFAYDMKKRVLCAVSDNCDIDYIVEILEHALYKS